MKTDLDSRFLIMRDESRCIHCQVCVRECPFGVNYYDEKGMLRSRDEACVGCERCISRCPTEAITLKRNLPAYETGSAWTRETAGDITWEAENGAVILTGGGTRKHPVYWDRLLLNASQVTNPSLDPLREPIELVTYLGRKAERVELSPEGRLTTRLAPQVRLETPIIFSAMSLGAVSLAVQESLARAATKLGTLWNCGEGGLHPSLYPYHENTIVQVASGRFGVSPSYLKKARIIEIKIGQGAKPGIGGHLPGEKVTREIATTRMIPEGTDAISPAPHHDIYSIEDLAQLIAVLKEVTDYDKPIAVKIAAVHNSAAIASGIARAGADIIVIDGSSGGTGAAPKVIRDNVGLPLEFALASIDERLRKDSLRQQVSLVASGSIRNSADAAKAIALGADAVAIGTAALIALGCRLCQQCHTGKCPWGLCTQDPALSRRFDSERGSQKLINLINAWSLELKEMLGGMGINAIESLRGNRDELRGIGLNEKELSILGLRMAGE